MKMLLLFPLLLLSLAGCQVGTNGWKQSDAPRIHLFTRPDQFSEGIVHSDSAIQNVLQEQGTYITEFEKRFGVTFEGSITIYLYNPDERNVKAGPGGGYSDPSTSTIFYRFFPPSLNINGTAGPMGGHEIFHILAGKTFGPPSSRLLAEGGAVWFDGGYSSEAVEGGWKRKGVVRWMRELVDRGELKTPSELAGDVGHIEEGVFYPQAGFVVQWMVDRFGLGHFAQLLRLSGKSQALETAVRAVYGMTIEELNGLGAKSSFAGFEQWSDATYGPEKKQEFARIVKQANEGLLSEVLGLTTEAIDSEYKTWVRKTLDQ